MEFEIASEDVSGPLLVQTAANIPVIARVGEGGEDVLCPACGKVVLLANAVDGAWYDFAVRCFGCGAVSTAPPFPRGRGLSAVLWTPREGRVEIAASFVVHDEVIIGARGIRQRAHETGRANQSAELNRRLLDLAGIEAVVAHARETFGPILATLERRSADKPTSEHRLLHLLRAIEQNLVELRAGGRDVDLWSIIELHRMSAAFARWRSDPSFTRLMQESADPRYFAHNVALLGVASALEDAGLGPELVTPGGDGRTPDLYLRLTATRLIEADVKAPPTLQRRPNEAVPVKLAKDVVADVVRRSRGQFSTTALLVIAGAFWQGEFDEYASAAEAALARPLPDEATAEAREHHTNVAGLILASTSIASRNAGGQVSDDDWSRVEWSPFSSYYWVANPQYAREAEVDFADDLSSFHIRLPGAPPADAASTPREPHSTW